MEVMHWIIYKLKIIICDNENVTALKIHIDTNFKCFVYIMKNLTMLLNTKVVKSFLMLLYSDFSVST